MIVKFLNLANDGKELKEVHGLESQALGQISTHFIKTLKEVLQDHKDVLTDVYHNSIIKINFFVAYGDYLKPRYAGISLFQLGGLLFSIRSVLSSMKNQSRQGMAHVMSYSQSIDKHASRLKDMSNSWILSLKNGGKA